MAIHGQIFRAPAVAGRFYPDDRGELVEMIRGFLSGPALTIPAPKALIAPHAGFVYSGPVAGTAFSQLQRVRTSVTRVVIAGPSHRVPFAGIAMSSASAFATPLGRVPVDRAACDAIASLHGIHTLDIAHAAEHSIETHLPFLQLALGEFAIVPLVVGDTRPATVAAAFDALWGGPETLICVSSDLSHYLPYDDARRTDAATSRAIANLDPDGVGNTGACGWIAVRALLLAAKRHGLAAHVLDVRNSGDTAGPRNEVVGYGAYAFS